VGPQGAVNLGPNGQPRQIPTGPRPHGIAVDQQTHLLYITRTLRTADVTDNVVEVVDPKPATPTVKLLYRAPADSQPVDIVYDPAARRVYAAMLGVAGSMPPNVTVIHVPTGRAMPVLTRSNPLALAIDARGQVYSASGGGVELIPAGIPIVPGSAAQVQLTLPLSGRGPLSVAANPVTGEAYIGDTGDGTVRAVPPVDASITAQGR
jgi:DNA-binding beta-propeller fold protein YncE